MITTLLFVPRRSAGVCDVSQMQVWVERKSFCLLGFADLLVFAGQSRHVGCLSQYIAINGAVVSRSKRLQMLQYLLLDEVFYSLMRISLCCRV